MAVHRSEKPQAEIPDAKFVEQLVKRSLAINPGLRNGYSTTAFLEKLRDEALHAKTAAPATATPQARTADDSRANTVTLFMRQRVADYERERARLREREDQIKQEVEALKKVGVQDVIDFFAIVYTGADAPPADVLKPYKVFFAELGITEADIARRFRQRTSSR